VERSPEGAGAEAMTDAEKLAKVNATCSRLQAKNDKQRNDIARLTMKLVAVTKDKTDLLRKIKWMRGEIDE
jgi:hypothetical protein